jgi:hypothetical protein
MQVVIAVSAWRYSNPSVVYLPSSSRPAPLVVTPRWPAVVTSFSSVWKLEQLLDWRRQQAIFLEIVEQIVE